MRADGCDLDYCIPINLMLIHEEPIATGDYSGLH